MNYFKPWVSDWLGRITIFMVVLPGLLPFALYYSNMEDTAGYYGISTYDVQYSVVLMYGSLIGFFSLDSRLLNYIRPKNYFLIGVFVNTATYMVGYLSRDSSLFFVCRFMQGFVCSLLCGVSLNLIFSKLHSSRSRIMGYGIFYGILQVSIPICAFLCSLTLHYFNFSVVYLILIAIQLPGVILLLLTMKDIRFRRKYPLYQIDWLGFIVYTFLCCAAGYILIYGQELNWFASRQLLVLSLAVGLCMILFVIRQLHRKRPYINMGLFKFADFRNALLLFIVYYIFKGTTGMAYGFAGFSLHLQSIYLTPIWIFNIIGIIVGMGISIRFLLLDTSANRVLMAGFFALLIYHVLMYYQFSIQGLTANLFLPFFIQGVGTGMCMLPIVLFMLRSLPRNIQPHASFLGITARFFGFCTGIAMTNFFTLKNKSKYTDVLGREVNGLNHFYKQHLADISGSAVSNGADLETGRSLAAKYMAKSINQQVSLLSYMDYYSLIIVLIVVSIVLILTLPKLKASMITIAKKYISI